jgi:hypothetical protein
MENLRAISERYLEKTLENPKRFGTPYTLIDPQDALHEVTGTVGDISVLLNPSTGETIQGRTITATCLMKRLPVPPCRGWRAQLPELSGKIQELFIQGVAPDYTAGLYYFTMGLDLAESA